MTAFLTGGDSRIPKKSCAERGKYLVEKRESCHTEASTSKSVKEKQCSQSRKDDSLSTLLAHTLTLSPGRASASDFPVITGLPPLRLC